MTISNGVKIIRGNAFSRCSGLASVMIPDSVTRIENDAFYGCSGIESFKVSPDNMKYKAESNLLLSKDGTTLVMVPCSLTSVKIPDGVKSIGAYAFSECSELRKVKIPDSVTSIEKGAFFYCSGLTSVTIPGSVTSIRRRAFYGCSGLRAANVPRQFMGKLGGIFEECAEDLRITYNVHVGNSAQAGEQKSGTDVAVRKSGIADKKWHVMLSPSATAADAAAVAKRMGVEFENSVKVRITLRETKSPDPDNWSFTPEYDAIMSVWGGDVQLHLGAIAAAVKKSGKKTGTMTWNGFKIKIEDISNAVFECTGLSIEDCKNNVNIVNRYGVERGVDMSGLNGQQSSLYATSRYAEIIETRPEASVSFFRDLDRVVGEMGVDAITATLRKTHKLSYVDAVYMVEDELNVSRLVARHLLKEWDVHWNYYQEPRVKFSRKERKERIKQ